MFEHVTLLSPAAILLVLSGAPAQYPVEPVLTQDEPTCQSALSRQAGEWEGIFQRLDSSGKLIEQFSSHIHIDMPEPCNGPYQQINTYIREGQPVQKIISSGIVANGIIRFENATVAGWAAAERNSDQGQISTLTIQNKDGSGYMVEQIHLSANGLQRHRVAQYFDASGTLLRRTLIAEKRPGAD